MYGKKLRRSDGKIVGLGRKLGGGNFEKENKRKREKGKYLLSS